MIGAIFLSFRNFPGREKQFIVFLHSNSDVYTTDIKPFVVLLIIAAPVMEDQGALELLALQPSNGAHLMHCIHNILIWNKAKEGQVPVIICDPSFHHEVQLNRIKRLVNLRYTHALQASIILRYQIHVCYSLNTETQCFGNFLTYDVYTLVSVSSVYTHNHPHVHTYLHSHTCMKCVGLRHVCTV